MSLTSTSQVKVIEVSDSSSCLNTNGVTSGSSVTSAGGAAHNSKIFLLVLTNIFTENINADKIRLPLADRVDTRAGEIALRLCSEIAQGEILPSLRQPLFPPATRILELIDTKGLKLS